MAKRKWKTRVALAAALVLSPCVNSSAQIVNTQANSAERDFNQAVDVDQSGWLFLPYAQFKIPFNVEPGGSTPAQVQLFVSADQGATWQPHSKLASDRRYFEFRAASEGAYLFGVRTKDALGNSFDSSAPPMRVIVDTTKPQASLQADLDSSGRLIAILEINEQYLDLPTIQLQYRIDVESNWIDANIAELNRQGDTFRGHAVIAPGRCREVWLRLLSADLAQNKGEASFNYKMPRTATAPTGLMVSQRDSENRIDSPTRGSTPGSMLWPSGSVPSLTMKPGTNNPHTALPSNGQTKPTRDRQDLSAWAEVRIPARSGLTNPPPVSKNAAPRTMVSLDGPSEEESLQLPGNANGILASSSNFPIQSTNNAEQLPAPRPQVPTESLRLDGSLPKADAKQSNTSAPAIDEKSPESSLSTDSVERATTPFSRAYHSRSRAFSLDYSVESVKGSQVAEIELWGTEDGGRTWVEWGKDPDRESPFDIQVADDGLFGFRMVIVSRNGLVSNRPKDGDDADMWINVDSIAPVVKITRAVYGEGEKTGMLVIDYKCDDNNLHEQPITLSYSDHQEGPWTTIASGLRNAGVYLWKAGANLPSKIYLRIEATDRGGNVGTNRLDIPIAVEGLAPRGRIQGFRPLDTKSLRN